MTQERSGEPPTEHEAGGPVVIGTQPAADVGAFDPHHPPDPDLLSDCVHCGFCLPTCPTYVLWGEEMDSPRGRIYLMELGIQAEVAMDQVFVQHLDACLGCMACVTSCPSGVQYDKLIEATRAQIERNYPRSRGERLFRRLIFALFPYPARLRVAAALAWAYQRSGVRAGVARSGVLDRLPGRLRALEQLLPPVTLARLRLRPPTRLRASGQRRQRVGLLAGCVQSVFFSDVNAATARVLAAEGCEVVTPRDQGCCGALMVHAGEEADALALARRMIATMEAQEVDTVAVNAAGCGSTMKEYGHLLRDDPAWAERAAAFSAKVRDVTELLDELGPQARRHPIRARVAYHDACHLAHAQGVRRQPRDLLRAIPGLDVVDIGEADICCGSAGVYNLLQPEAAEALGRRKAGNIRATGADAVATGNPGCLLQIRRYAVGDVRLLHPIELIDASIRGQDPIGAARNERHTA